MTLEEMTALFEQHNDEWFLKRGEETKLRDFDAFVLIEKLVPSDRDIISAAEHDQYWLAVDEEELAAVITEDQIKYLLQCGIMHEEGMGLSVFA